jgi:hypothetical protein
VGHQVQWRLGFRVEEKKAKFVRRDGWGEGKIV